MNRDKVLELAREAELARQFALEVPFVVDRLERFAALIEREVRGDAKSVAWQYYDKELGKWFASEAPLSVRKEFEAEGYKTEDLFEIRTPSTKKKKI